MTNRRKKTMVVILSIVFIVIVLDYFSNYFGCTLFLCEYFGGLVTEFIGILVTVLIIDLMRERWETNNNAEILAGRWPLLEMRFNKVQQYLYGITNSLEGNNYPLGTPITKINFISLKNIFNPTLYTSDNTLSKGAFEYFVEEKKKLYLSVSSFQALIIQNSFPELHKSATNLLMNLDAEDFTDGIQSSFVIAGIKNDGGRQFKPKEIYLQLFDEYSDSTESGKIIEANFITPYQLFYFHINGVLESWMEFEKQLKKVIGKKVVM